MAEFNQDFVKMLQDAARNTDNNIPDTIALSIFGAELSNITRQLNKSNLDNEKKIQILREVQRRREENFMNLDFKKRKELLESQNKRLKEEKKNLEQLKELQEAARKHGAEDYANKLGEQIEALQEAIDQNTKSSSEDLKKQRKGVAKGSKEYEDLTKAIKETKKEEREYRREEAADKTIDAIYKKLGVERDSEDTKKDVAGKVLSASIDKLAAVADKYFEQAETILTQYNAKITARLEGSGKQYTDLSKVIKQNLSVSTIVKQQDVLNNLSRLVDTGIAYNLEQRAFIATVKDDIAQTFDAFDSNLLQIIRLQRTDSTMARMGLESALQSFFNENFLDTEYLTDLRKSVSGALIDVEATMVNEEAAQFEYIVQKWLGSLYSMGASSNLINQIASGINMLGTGNVQGLSGSPMQTLFAMAANRSGMSYADLLTSGLSSANTNQLLKSMVEYLADISESTKENRVVSGAYGSIFNMTQADLRAIRNITNDISTIYDSTMTYNQFNTAASQGIANIGSRIPFQQRAKTLMENLKFSAAENIINNPIAYYTLMATNFIEDMTGGLNFEAAPFGIGISGTATGLIKSGLFGISFLSEVLSNLDKLNNPGLVGDAFLGSNPGEMRGSGFNLADRYGTSQSYSAGGSTEDITAQNFKEASKQANDVKEGIKFDEDTIAIEDIFNSLVSSKSETGQLSSVATSNNALLTLLNNSFVSDLNAQRVIITGFNLGDAASIVEFPVKFGSAGTEQIRAFTNGLSTSIKGTDEATIYMLINLLYQALAENGAINVNLASSSLPLTDLVTGRGTPESTKTLPSGNNLSTPYSNARNTASGRAILNDKYNVLM